MTKARAWTCFALLAAIGGAGCSAIHDTFPGLFGESASPTPTAAAGQVYYSAVEGLAVYEKPASGSKLVGRLGRYEQVTRTRQERDYAFVRSAKSGLEGWVDNALLLWRIPTGEKEPVKPAVERPGT